MLEPVTTFTEDGLALGATILAPASSDPEVTLAAAEPRILALLSVAYGRTIRPEVLGHIRRAMRYWRQGENALAAIEIALSGLPPLSDEKQAAARLSLGEQLLAAGLSPRELTKACGLDPDAFDVLKAGYNPDQPRVPAGNPDGGEWTGVGGEESGSSVPPEPEPSSAAGGTSIAGGTLHGYATVYSKALKGRPTATGEPYDPNKMTAAVLPGTIPLKSVVTVTLDSDPSRSVEVYVNDHGLYQRILNPDGTFTNHPLPGRVIDLSSAAFKALTGMDSGKVMVTVAVKPSSPK